MLQCCIPWTPYLIHCDIVTHYCESVRAFICFHEFKKKRASTHTHSHNSTKPPHKRNATQFSQYDDDHWFIQSLILIVNRHTPSPIVIGHRQSSSIQSSYSMHIYSAAQSVISRSSFNCLFCFPFRLPFLAIASLVCTFRFTWYFIIDRSSNRMDFIWKANFIVSFFTVYYAIVYIPIYFIAEDTRYIWCNI